MIKKYVEKLIKNLPKESRKKQTIDVIFDGGAFNGSYLIGAVYFLKSMEHKSYIKIDRISSCSIGSFISLLYVADCLDVFPELYQMLSRNFKNNRQFNNYSAICDKLKPLLPENICELMTNKVYITFHDLKKNKKIVKSKYNSVDDIFETIYRSCFLPILMDGNLLYKNKYMDGGNAFIFNDEPKKKILFLNLMSSDKLGSLFNIKNEKTNYHRILSGLLDIHNFYIKGSSTQMCSYVENWGLTDNTHFLIKRSIERLIVYFIRIYMYLKKFILPDLSGNIFGKIFGKIVCEIYITTIDHYCF
jgi:hypothetical protein